MTTKQVTAVARTILSRFNEQLELHCDPDQDDRFLAQQFDKYAPVNSIKISDRWCELMDRQMAA